jgi:transposase InsO family protein
MVKAMDALLQAGAQIGNVAAWCREHGVDPRTFYRHKARIEAEGRWQERSRRPCRSPGATGADLEAWIVKLRKDLGPDNGADYIRDELIRIHAQTNPPWRVPSRSTINRVLARHDLLEKNPAKRPRSSWRRFSFARPRDCYQIDATFYRLAGGQLVAIFEVLDDCSRMLVACRAAVAETAEAAIAAITWAVTEHGAPALVLSDNGTAFTSRLIHANAGPSRFAQAVHRWGSRLIHASPYHPQTCGKVERHHQTLKKWLASQPHQPATLRQLQRLLDTYRAYYNTRRPHSALGRATPHHVWTTAASLGGPARLPVQTDATVHRLRVSATGTIIIGHRCRIGVGTAHTGHTVTAIRDANHVTVYDPDGHPLGHVTLDAAKSYIPLTSTA